MFFRQLKYFMAVAEAGRFTEAAKRINVSQPALGLQIKNLEEELGVTLFDRHSRGVKLTDAGNILLDYANEIISKIEEAKLAIKDVAGTVLGDIHIGITPTIGRHLLHPISESCSEIYPKLVLSFTKGYSDELHEAVLANELNLAFSYDPGAIDKLVSEALLIDQFYLVGHKDLIGCQRRRKFSPLGRSKSSPLNVSRNTVVAGCPGSP